MADEWARGPCDHGQIVPVDYDVYCGQTVKPLRVMPRALFSLLWTDRVPRKRPATTDSLNKTIGSIKGRV